MTETILMQIFSVSQKPSTEFHTDAYYTKSGIMDLLHNCVNTSMAKRVQHGNAQRKGYLMLCRQTISLLQSTCRPVSLQKDNLLTTQFVHRLQNKELKQCLLYF